MMARVGTYLAFAGGLGLALFFAWWQVSSHWYDLGVRDERIKTQSATAVKNYELRQAQDKAAEAAAGFETMSRALDEQTRRLAYERAIDPDGAGRCISDAGWLRYFSIRP